jgi:hypothetical protein
VTLSTGFCDGASWSVRWLPASYPVPVWPQRFSLFRWFTFTMAQHVFACATHRFLLDRVSGLRFPDTAVYPRFSPLRTSRQTGGHAFTSAPEGQGLHLHGDEVTRLKVNLNLAVCPEAAASFRPTGRTADYVVNRWNVEKSSHHDVNPMRLLAFRLVELCRLGWNIRSNPRAKRHSASSSYGVLVVRCSLPGIV